MHIMDNLRSEHLLVFPSRRSLLQYHKQEGLCQPSMSLGEFFAKAIYYPNKAILPHIMRKFILSWVLRNYDRHNKHNGLEKSGLVFETSFIAYLQSSEFFLQFFDELFVHKKAIADIPLLDTYGEYQDHLRILEAIYTEYCAVLEAKSWVYRNWDFKLADLWLRDFTHITIMLYGTLTPFEQEILREVAKICSVRVQIGYNESRFVDIFDTSLELDSQYSYIVAYPSGEIVEKIPLHTKQAIEAYSFLSRIEQVGAIREQIQKWLAQGVPPESMCIVLPKEDFTRYLEVLDKEHNFNYAMGKPFKRTHLYTLLLTLIQDSPPSSYESLRACLKESFMRLNSLEQSQMQGVMQRLEEILYTYEAMNEFLDELRFAQIAESFLREIESINIDDIHGGRIRVMGVLETRGIKLEYVIVPDCNEGVIPNLLSSDLFLNTTLRKKLKMPTTYDKEALQVLYYKSILLNAKQAVVLCVQDEKNAPAHLLEELGCVVKENSASIFAHTLKTLPTYKQERYIGRLPKSFSPTSFNILMRCQRQYCFKYMLGLNEEDSQNDAITLGILAHKALEEAYKPYITQKVDLQAIERIYKACVTFLQTQDMKNALMQAHLEILLLDMKRFFEFERTNIKNFGAFEILGLEQELEPFKIWEYKFAKARADRIQRMRDGSVFVIDYKYRHKVEDVDNDFSLELYKIGLSARYDKIEAMYYDIKGAKSVPINKEKVKLLREALQTLDSHFNKPYQKETGSVLVAHKNTESLTQGYGEFSPSENASVCRYCAYTTLCDR